MSPSNDVLHAYALASDLRVLVSQLRRRIQERSNLGEVTPSQVAVLRRLERDGPATVTALARDEGMRPQSMGANIAALDAAGLVSGAPDPKDGRQTIISLPPLCRERVNGQSHRAVQCGRR